MCSRLLVGLVLILSPAAIAADEAKPDQWERLYHDATAQLRAAQDRRAELAAQNTRLLQNVAELHTRLELAEDELTGLRRELDSLAIQSTAFPLLDPPAWVDTQWPLSSVDAQWIDQ